MSSVECKPKNRWISTLVFDHFAHTGRTNLRKLRIFSMKRPPLHKGAGKNL